MFEAMKGEGVERDVFTHNTVLDALCKAGDLNRAVEVLECMGHEGVQPNVVGEGVGGCIAPGQEWAATDQLCSAGGWLGELQHAVGRVREGGEGAGGPRGVREDEEGGGKA